MEFDGDFETHITLSFQQSNTLEQLREWAENHLLKCLCIILERGKTVCQPMLTRRGNGTLSGELLKAREIVCNLEKENFRVTRIKIEATIFNKNVPETNFDSAADNRYFEHHLKLLLDSSSDVSRLLEIAEMHSAHLSHNAFRRFRSDGNEERFITQRCKNVGLDEAGMRFEKLRNAIENANYSIIKSEREFVVYDDNIKIDDGWILTEDFS